MTIKFLLFVASVIFTVFVVIIGFGWWDDQASHVWGWFGLSWGTFVMAWFPFAERPVNRP